MQVLGLESARVAFSYPGAEMGRAHRASRESRVRALADIDAELDDDRYQPRDAADSASAPAMSVESLIARVGQPAAAAMLSAMGGSYPPSSLRQFLSSTVVPELVPVLVQDQAVLDVQAWARGDACAARAPR